VGVGSSGPVVGDEQGPAVHPYGCWPSPIGPSSVGASRVSRAGLQVVGDQAFWLASDPAAGGVQGVRRLDLAAFADGRDRGVDRLGPRDLDCRSGVHGYGGGALCAWPEGLAVVERTSGRVALLLGAQGEEVRWLTSPAPAGERWWHGDLAVVPGGRWLVAVRERVTADDPSAGADEVVAIPVGGGEPIVVASGRAFYAAPRPSPDGRWLALVCWEPPAMPWDESELWLWPLALEGSGPGAGTGRRVAGGPGEAVGQPLWVGEDLWFVSDRSGFAEPWRLRVGEQRPELPVPLRADCQGPAWSLGQRTLVALGDGRVLTTVRTERGDQLAVLDPEAGQAEWLAQPLVQVAEVAPWRGGILAIGVGAREPAGVVLLESGGARWCREDGGAGSSWPTAALAVAEPGTFEAEDGFVGHLLVFRPVSALAEGPAGGRPPLLVLCHGGPTGAAEASFDPMVQFWTSRGFLVCGVDYRGSSGFGRAYQQALSGRWGEADAADVVAAARQLVAAGAVDPDRLAVRGASAGGLTALEAATSGLFHAAVVAYGVTDLATLRRDTHRFEAHYLDRLVGPLPAAAALDEARSPARHPERLRAAVLLLQGTEDPIVPPSQALAMAEAMASAGGRFELRFLPGEGHGFRAATSVEAAMAAEERFLRRVLRLCQPGDVEGPEP
jgi:dipeptidyl aminopeptidase/acylaminoacyl peptidase